MRTAFVFRSEHVGLLGTILAVWLAAFALACQLESGLLAQGRGAEDVLTRVLGVAGKALSGRFYEEADNYFHHGVGYVRPMAFTNVWFAQMYTLLNPHEHRHVEGYSVREIMPWLQFAVRADPHNVDAYLVTAYWLSSALKRPDLADQLLTEAQMANPGDYRVLMERAIIAFRSHDDQKAARLFDAALRLWRPEGITDPDRAKRDRVQMLSFRGFLYELHGDEQRALEVFRECAGLDPENRAIAERVAAMERGESFIAMDRRVWESMVRGVEGKHDEDHEHEHDRSHALRDHM